MKEFDFSKNWESTAISEKLKFAEFWKLHLDTLANQVHVMALWNNYHYINQNNLQP